MLQSLAVAEIANIRHSRDFRSPSIFDFFNSIGTFRTWRDVRLESAMRSKADVDYANRSAPACVDDKYPPDGCMVIQPCAMAALTAAPYPGGLPQGERRMPVRRAIFTHVGRSTVTFARSVIGLVPLP
jgi:hypothetical protein